MKMMNLAVINVSPQSLPPELEVTMNVGSRPIWFLIREFGIWIPATDVMGMCLNVRGGEKGETLYHIVISLLA